jgi:hypothetical protein
LSSAVARSSAATEAWAVALTIPEVNLKLVTGAVTYRKQSPTAEPFENGGEHLPSISDLDAVECIEKNCNLGQEVTERQVAGVFDGDQQT